MSAYNCGCDPEAGWTCNEFPSCTWGRSKHLAPLEPVLIYGSTPGADQTPAFKAVKKLLQEGIDKLNSTPFSYEDDPMLTATFESIRPEPGAGPRELSLNEYQRSLHTYKDRHHECHALGLVGELAEVTEELFPREPGPSRAIDAINAFRASGRVADMVKKATAHGVPLDPSKLKKELGDVLWYITAVASDNGLTLQDIAEANVAKLRERYPSGFIKGGGVREVCPLPANHEGHCELMHTIVLPAPRVASSVSFACGCSEQTIDGVLTRRYCPNGECRRLAR